MVDWLADGKRPYVFAHQPENGESPSLARQFHALVAERVPDLTSLPQPIVVPTSSEADQASLF